MRILSVFTLLALIACGGTEEPAGHDGAADADHAEGHEGHDGHDGHGDTPKPAEAAPKTPEPWVLPEDANPAMLKPELANETAPNTYKVKLETTKGDILVQVNREWAPQGADRFYNLVKIGYFSDIAFFRTIPGFMSQFGISGYPAVTEAWRAARIDDDTVAQSNTRGRLTFATAGPNTRTTQLFINYKDNSMLDAQGFSPIGEVLEGMDVVDNLYGGYGEGAPRGRGPSQAILTRSGNAYLEEKFPKLDYIKAARIVD